LSSKPIMNTSAPGDRDPILLSARDDLARGDLRRALHAYNHLIQRNRSLDAVLPDLAQLVKKYPRDPQVWRVLGDALAQAGNADHAAQSYERARQLTGEEDSAESSTS
jgi:cytochrome c-type biogenesis protein CcmH/NrfG